MKSVNSAHVNITCKCKLHEDSVTDCNSILKIISVVLFN